MSRGVNKVILVSPWQMADLYRYGMSIHEIHGITDVALSTIRFRLSKLQILRSVGDGVRNAASKGRLGGGFRGKNRFFTKEHRNAITTSLIKRGEETAKGFSKKPNGYVEITRGSNKGRLQHRVLMESALKRKLQNDEHVHHIDGNKSNNDISNLQLMSASEHLSQHAKENYPSRKRGANGTWN